MNTEQTIFDDSGEPLGTATIDCQTGAVTFRPRDGTSLAQRTWRSLAALKRAVLREIGSSPGVPPRRASSMSIFMHVTRNKKRESERAGLDDSAFLKEAVQPASLNPAAETEENDRQPNH